MTQLNSDEYLLKRALDGDKQAFAVLYQRYGERLFRFFRNTLKHDESNAADFTQELFLKVLTKGHLFQSGGHFSTWLYRIAWNMCKNHWRAQKKWDLSNEFVETLPDHEEDAPMLMDSEIVQRSEDCLKTLESLPKAHQICIQLRFYESLTIPEIAKILEVPEGTVKSRIHYALKKMALPLKIWKPE